jgi:hypothetical protein
MAPSSILKLTQCAWLSAFLLVCTLSGHAQEKVSPTGLDVYNALKEFQLAGERIVVENLTLERDRAVMTFNGTFYFEMPVAGRVRGAVFLGSGVFRAEPPQSGFERENLRRLLNADAVESDFKTAILRFSDDSYDQLVKGPLQAGTPAPDAAKLAEEFEARFLKETGANIAARLAVSIVNLEQPGFFLAQFDKGKRGRFVFLLDFQARVPVASFTINGGEKGLIFAHRAGPDENDIWMAFPSLQDYERGHVHYADFFDLVTIPHYAMQVDVRNPKKALKTEIRMDFISRVNALRVIPLVINEALPEYESARLKKALRLRGAWSTDGKPLSAVQEEWDGGVTLFLSAPHAAGDRFSVLIQFEGDFMFDSPAVPNCYYPLVAGDWYPRHGYLQRSTFDVTFHHRKNDRVAAVGVHIREDPVPGFPEEMVTEWRMDTPVAVATFGVGRFERHSETVKQAHGLLPVEFYSLPGSILAIKEDFMLAELMNCVKFFSALFGEYPYPSFGAMYHPRGFGQGLATMLLLPSSDSASKYTFSFIAHETSHQWWGNMVAWRSYRDQWLSEGFAEYSGVLYTGVRDSRKSSLELVRSMRESLKAAPRTQLGVGQGRVADVGPLILGHRLGTRETLNAYTTLIYSKGALVLRMLHFLFSDPATGDDKPFYEMMRDFVRRFQNGWASTDDFIQVADEHFVRTPIAQKYRLKDLKWFFAQWVYQAYLPSYRLDYRVQNQPDGSTLLNGTLYQEGCPENWFMPLPLVLKFGGNQTARGTIHALGPSTPVTVKLTARPREVELDPDFWILSEKTTSRGSK